MANKASRENDIKWWNNPAIVAEFEKEYKAWESGKEEGCDLAEVKTEIAGLKLEKSRVNKKSTKQ